MAVENLRISCGQSPPFSNLMLSLILCSVWVAAAQAAPEEAEEVAFQEGTMEGSAWPGVLVEVVSEGSAPGKAGLRAGDIVLSWKRSSAVKPGEAHGHIDSVFDWLWLELELAPRGPVQLIGERDKKPIVLDVEVGLWDVEVRPRLLPALGEDYLEGKEMVVAGALAPGIALWQEAADMAQGRGDEVFQCWLQLRIGEIWAEQRAWDKAHAAYRSALEVAREPQAQVAVWDAIGRSYERQNDFSEAEASYRSALEIRRATWAEGLGTAASLNNIGNIAFNRGDVERAAELFQRALKVQVELAPGSLCVASSLNNLGLVAVDRGDLERAAEYSHRALEVLEKLAPESLAAATSLSNLGNVAQYRGELERAKEYQQRALKIRENLSPGSLAVASSLNNLALVVWNRGGPEQVEELLQRALDIQESLAPGSLELATSLNHMGLLDLQLGNLDRAGERFQRALEIQEELAPRSLGLAYTLNNQGRVAWNRGELEQSEKLNQRALELREDLAPGSLELAASLNNLGVVAWRRGDLERAANHYRRALEIKEQLTPGSLSVAVSLNNLGTMARQRGDLERAAHHLQRALELREELTPGSLAVAESLGNLGTVARQRGDLERARELHQRDLEIQERLAPGSLSVATSLSNLGNVALERGDLEEAVQYLQRALEIREKLAPGNPDVTSILYSLGTVARQRGDLERAARYFRRALEIQERIAPGSLETAQVLNGLGNVARHLGDPEQAAAYFHRSMTALEAQVGKLGDSHELQGQFYGKHGSIYRDVLDLHIELDQPEASFDILERSRARSFLAMLSERDLDFSADSSEELEANRRRLTALYDRTLHQVMGLSPKQDKHKIESLTKSLRDLRREYEDNMEAIRRASPKLAALQDPLPLNLQGVRNSLDPQSVLLSYSVGERRSYLFVVTRDGGLVVHPLPVLESLKNDVALLRNLIQDRSLRPHRMARLVDLSHQLYKILIAPAKSVIETSERVLIVPDGPLHLLPFGALVHEPGTDPATPGKFLMEWKPLHFALSVTVFAELKNSRQAPEYGQRITLGAFGDPHYPERLDQANENSTADVRLRSAVERNFFDFQPLPSTRWEVEQIARIFPEAAQVYLGREATEDRAKSLEPATRILHFAAHAYSDDRDPLSSAVVLTIPEQLTDDHGNGLLQAWEILERLRFNADLVVLSACETGLGREQGGDGLISLSRAFQYAGARTVAASLWQVSDRVTAELMLRFYRRLAAGQPKDAALRGAQLSLIRDPVQVTNSRGELVMKDASAPYYWAAFQIYGDWQ